MAGSSRNHFTRLAVRHAKITPNAFDSPILNLGGVSLDVRRPSENLQQRGTSGGSMAKIRSIRI